MGRTMGGVPAQSPGRGMKAVKILRRPADAPPGAKLVDTGTLSATSSATAAIAATSSSTASAVSTTMDAQSKATLEISALMEAALSRERARLERLDAIRREALLRAVTDAVDSSLAKLVTTAASREASAMAAAVCALAPKPAAPRGPARADTRAAFAAAFASAALPPLQAATQQLLGSLAKQVDQAVDKRVAAPAAAAATAASQAAQKVSAAGHAVNAAIARAVPREDVDAVAVRALLADGKVAEALRRAVGHSNEAQLAAVDGALDCGLDAADVFKDARLPREMVVQIIVLLSAQLDDRKEARFSWLYEAVMSMDDSVQGSQAADVKTLLETGIANLRSFAQVEGVSGAEAKHIKLLVHVLNAHVTTI